MALAATLLTTTGCSDDEVNDAPVIPDDQKEMISFSVSDGTTTRAGFGGSATFIVMRMQSNEKGGSGALYTRTVATAAKDATSPTTAESYSDVSFNGEYQRYWDDAHGRKSLLSVFAVAIPNNATDTKGLEAKLAKGDDSKVWGANSTNTIEWSVTTSAQTKDAASENTAAISNGTIDGEDLVYSNNIKSGGKDGIYRWDFSAGTHKPDKTGATTHKDGQMLFFQDGVDLSAQPTDAPGHFDKGHLVFNHALSRLTITLVEGDGFDKTSTNKEKDFKFADETNITLLDMNIKGTLELPTGQWTIPTKEQGGIGNITKMAQTSTGTFAADYATEAYRNSKFITLTAQMLPDYVFNDANDTNVMQFTIDGNSYFITQNMLFDALVAVDANKTADYGYDSEDNNKFTMQQGKNYNFTIVINKTKIQAITASLVNWVDVKGEYPIDNSHITVTTYKQDGDDKYCKEFNFYRWGEKLDKIYTDDSYTANNFSGDYKTTGHAKLTETPSGSHIYDTNWFYESNDTAYHFRTLNDIAAGKNTFGKVDDSNIANNSNISSFTMVSGSQTTQDYHWGAPMKAGMATADFLKYSETDGFKNSIHKGIVAPKNNENNTINITELHMMSNINIRLITDSVDSPKALAPSAVNLENAKITITRFAKTGTVDMGIGLITPVYTAPDTHLLTGDDDCALMMTPDFVDTDNKGWKKEGNIHAGTDWFRYAVVPQALRRSDAETPAEADCIGITIQTSDNNEYYVITDLATIIASSVTDSRNQAKDTAITRWYPGHTYYYTIKISKKGIDAITCTVAPWVDVIAKDIDIDLES